MAEKSVEQRKVFGRYLRSLREACALSQQVAATRLVLEPEGQVLSWKKGEDAKLQFNLARIEGGRVSLQPEILPALSRIYKEPLDRLAAAYVASQIYGKNEVPGFLKVPSLKRVARAADSSFFLSSAIEAWTLEEIANWERGLADRFPDRTDLELWIVSPDFIDYKNREFQGIVVNDLITRGVTITYFIDARDYGYRQNFGTFLDRVTRLLAQNLESGASTKNPEQWGKIRVYCLSPDELAWFTSSVVIANPEDTQTSREGAEGFTIVPITGEEWVGIPLTGNNLEALAGRILRQVEDRIRIAEQSEKGWIGDALAEHPLYIERIMNRGK